MLTETQLVLVRDVLMRGPISRRHLAQRLDISASTLTRMVKPFLDRQIFIELEDHNYGTLGRPTKPLAINPQAAHVLGVKLTGQDTQAVVTDLGSDVIDSRVDSLADQSVSGVLGHLENIIAWALKISGGKLGAVAVSIGGSVDSDGVVSTAPFLGWKNVPLQELLAERVGLRVVVENDVVALTRGLLLFGEGRGLDSFSVITVGVGVGYGLVTNGQVVSRPGLAEHLPLLSKGPTCTVGHRGCAQALLTTGGICSQYEALTGTRISYEELLEFARVGDSVAAEIVAQTASALGTLIALSANLSLNDTVIIAGEGTGLWSVCGTEIWASVHRWRPPEVGQLRIAVQEPQGDSWSRGAAVAGIRAFLSGLTVSDRKP